VFLPVVLYCVYCTVPSLRMSVRGGELCSFLLCCMYCIVPSLRMSIQGGGLYSFLLCYVACLVSKYFVKDDKAIINCKTKRINQPQQVFP
jgi:hypothetical protein